MENSERLGQQARPRFEPGTSRLPILSVTTRPLVERYEDQKIKFVNISRIYRKAKLEETATTLGS